MSARNVLIAVLTAGIIVTALYNYHSTYDLMSSSSSELISPGNLDLSLTQLSSAPPTLRVTLRNSNLSTTLTALTWDTPLDPQAAALGVFHITDAGTGREVETTRVMLKRQLPPPRDALVELAPGEEATAEVVLKKPFVPLEEGKRYRVRAEGSWKAIWASRAEDVRDNELEELGGGERVIVGDFKSEETDVKVG